MSHLSDVNRYYPCMESSEMRCDGDGIVARSVSDLLPPVPKKVPRSVLRRDLTSHGGDAQLGLRRLIAWLRSD